MMATALHQGRSWVFPNPLKSSRGKKNLNVSFTERLHKTSQITGIWQNCSQDVGTQYSETKFKHDFLFPFALLLVHTYRYFNTAFKSIKSSVLQWEAKTSQGGTIEISQLLAIFTHRFLLIIFTNEANQGHNVLGMLVCSQVPIFKWIVRPELPYIWSLKTCYFSQAKEYQFDMPRIALQNAIHYWTRAHLPETAALSQPCVTWSVHKLCAQSHSYTTFERLRWKMTRKWRKLYC